MNKNSLLNLLLWLLCTIALGLSGWCLKSVATLQSEFSSIKTEHGQFLKTGDALELWKAIQAVRIDLAAYPREQPPPWFKERVDRMESSLREDIRSVDRKLDEHTRLHK